MNFAPHPPYRCIAYIDGFNLYFGIKEWKDRSLYWLDVAALATKLLRPDQQLVGTKYFTARISGPQPGDSPSYRMKRLKKVARQHAYLEALSTLPGVEIVEGQYFAKQRSCYHCSGTWTDHEEKMTDVNIATHVMVDAFQDRFDTALILSADSDLVPPVHAVTSLFPSKRVVCFFPPNRFSDRLKQAAHGVMRINKQHLKKSQLPDPVIKPGPSPFAIHCPSKWK